MGSKPSCSPGAWGDTENTTCHTLSPLPASITSTKNALSFALLKRSGKPKHTSLSTQMSALTAVLASLNALLMQFSQTLMCQKAKRHGLSETPSNQSMLKSQKATHQCWPIEPHTATLISWPRTNVLEGQKMKME